MKFRNAVLEYRLRKGNDQFVPIYHYPEIELEQILARRECEFFVKDGITYKQLSSAIEENLFIIYVEIYEEGPVDAAILTEDGILLEVRELNSLKGYPLLTSEYLTDHLDVLSTLGSVYTYHQQQEWERDSAEIDEDRKAYVLYVTATGYSITD
ncbi:hypothetical protein [Bacillus tuaregi]|uniref:hypothetical protein n=1 Tax=Bacillus tuaregi TaxID=1816695 RepID=UPI0008F869B0|nr:hypothetical protein [Bacillus tuaregi]